MAVERGVGAWLAPDGAVNRRLERLAPLITAGLLVLGALWRVLWVLKADRLEPLNSEALNVARAFASRGELADAYGPGMGPTAHLSPLIPALGGFVYRTFGFGHAAEFTLVLVAIAFALTSFLCLERCFKLLGMPALLRLGALAFVCLAPINAITELRQLRLFEGLLATAMSSALLLLIVWMSQQPRVGWKPLAGLALGAALLALTNQAAALGVYGAAGLLILLRVDWRRWFGVAALFAVALAIVLTPWGLRNERALHHFIVTRSNFGLELAQAYYPGAVDPPDAQAEFRRRHNTMHPFMSPEAREKIRAVGEVEFASDLGRQSMAWIRSNPTDAARIAVRSFRQYWFPDPWLWAPFGGPVRSEYLFKSVVVWGLTVAAFLGLALSLRRRPERWIYVACALVLPSLPYILVQPVLRYHYLVSSLLVFLAFHALWAVMTLRRDPAA